MADSNSLILLPPRHTAQAPADNSSRKTDKPSKDSSFGHKLDKAKKAIVTASIKQPVTTSKTAPDAKDAEPTTPPDDTQPAPAPDAQATTADDASKVKLPAKPVLKVIKPTDSPDETDEEKADNTQPAQAKPVAPVKTGTEKPKKAGKSPVVKNSPVKKSDADSTQLTQQAVTATAGNASDENDSNPDSDTDADADSNEIAGVNTQEYGSGKLVNRNAITGTNSQATNPADTDPQTAATTATPSDSDPVAAPAAEVATAVEDDVTKSVATTSTHTSDAAPGTANLAASPTAPHAATVSAKASTPAPTASPQVQFAEDNHPKIVSGIQGQLLPNGGTMQLQLNPASLGALQVTVHIADGVVTASFETSNDDATKLLSHSLGQLKAGLEAAGVSVEKLHVEQAPQRDTKNDSGGSDSKQAMQDQQKNAQQDQQRREMVQKMWRRLAGGSDPLDLVA